MTETVLDPRSLGIPLRTPDELRAGEPVSVVRRLLAGELGAVRDVVLLNAAAALSTTGCSLESCLDLCAAAVDSGAAAATLERWVLT